MSTVWRAVMGLILFLAADASAQALLRVRSHVVVAPGRDVHLIQLVDFHGLSTASEEKLRSTILTQAPEYGDRQELARSGLVELLRPIVQEERKRSKIQVKLVIPSSVIVDTLKREMDPSMVASELIEVWQPSCPDCQMEVEGLSLPAVQGVRDWSLQIKPDMPSGSFSIPINIIRMDHAPVQAWVSGRLKIKRNVPVLTRSLAMGERIQTPDFKWEYRDTSYNLDGIPAENAILGMKVKRAMRAREVVWASLLEREKAIRRGELVQLKSSEQNWEVSVSAIAQQDAVVGDVITLKNPKTNASMMGQVVADGEVVLK
ncbi:MAG: flagellar basal body P-ring formation chaperone FlgA [Bdellovibrionales bacterium]